MSAPQRSLSSQLKIAFGLCLVVAAVFGITYISLYTASDTKPVDGTSKDPVAGKIKKPIETTLVEMKYDPNYFAENKENKVPLEHLVFEGFYEPGGTTHWVSFWVSNKQTDPVEVTAINRSCSSCSEVRVAVVPAAAHQEFVQRSAAASLTPHLGVPELVTALAAVAYSQATTTQPGWQSLDFDNPRAVATIPAASNGLPTAACIQLGFKISGKELGPKELDTTLGFRTSDMSLPWHQLFKVSIVRVPAFEVFPKLLDFEEIEERSPPQTKDVVVWSMTRDSDGMGWLSGLASDPWIEVGKPVPLNALELQHLSSELSRGSVPIHLKCAFRFPITLRRESTRGDTRRPLDIGPLERVVTFASSISSTLEAKTIVKANILGLVRLVGGGTFQLGDFNGRNGTIKSGQLVSDQLDLDLVLVPDPDMPRQLQVTLDPPTLQGGKRMWAFKVEVKPNELLGDLHPSSVLTFQVKGGTQLIRIPIKGRGFLR